jgi:hypothetical protein
VQFALLQPEIAVAAPRFPRVKPSEGHYESYFVRAAAPSGGKAFWLRHTVHQRPGHAQTASLWLTLFDGDSVRAGKATLPGASAPDADYFAAPEASINTAAAHGQLRSPTLDADWSFDFSGDDAEQLHLPLPWLYRTPLPRTKSATPHPGVTFAGGVGPFDITGWKGLVSHNWGSEHAARWIWIHAILPHGWLEVVAARIAVGPWLTPWVATGALQLDGRRHRLGGMRHARDTRIHTRTTGAEMTLGAEQMRLRLEIAAPAHRFVSWRYADPGGPEHHTAHCAVADLQLEIEPEGQPPRRLQVDAAASYEHGVPAGGHDLPVQPYADGELL